MLPIATQERDPGIADRQINAPQGLTTNNTLLAPQDNQKLSVLDAYGDFARNYLIARQYSQKTVDGYWWVIKSFIAAVGNISTADISEAHIGEWVSYMDSKENQQSTMHTNVSLFRVFVDYLHVRGDCHLSKEMIKAPKKPKKHPHYRKMDEVERMITVCKNLRDRTIISMLFVTGLRNSELRNLRRSDVSGPDVQIRAGKGLKDRVVLLDQKTQQMLEQYLATRYDDVAYLFISNRMTKLGNSTLRRLVNDAGRLSGVGATNPHALRHGCGTYMMRQGVHMRVVQEYLGHESMSMTQLYTHVESDDIRSGHKRAFEAQHLNIKSAKKA